jgi:hypothetical protein
MGRAEPRPRVVAKCRHPRERGCRKSTRIPANAGIWNGIDGNWIPDLDRRKHWREGREIRGCGSGLPWIQFQIRAFAGMTFMGLFHPFALFCDSLERGCRKTPSRGRNVLVRHSRPRVREGRLRRVCLCAVSAQTLRRASMSVASPRRRRRVPRQILRSQACIGAPSSSTRACRRHQGGHAATTSRKPTHSHGCPPQPALADGGGHDGLLRQPRRRGSRGLRAT